MAYVYTACAVRAIIFSGKFRPVSNFTELHAFTLAAHSYAFLMEVWLCPLALCVNEHSRGQTPDTKVLHSQDYDQQRVSIALEATFRTKIVCIIFNPNCAAVASFPGPAHPSSLAGRTWVVQLLEAEWTTLGTFNKHGWKFPWSWLNRAFSSCDHNSVH